MKKKILASILCVALVASVLAGCGKKGLSGKTFTLKKVSAEGIDMDVKEFAEAQGVDEYKMEIKFDDDKATLTATGQEKAESKYTFKNDTVTFDDNGTKTTLKYNDSKDTLTYEISGVKMTLEEK